MSNAEVLAASALACVASLVLWMFLDYVEAKIGGR